MGEDGKYYSRVIKKHFNEELVKKIITILKTT